jgi:hypothetical protein
MVWTVFSLGLYLICAALVSYVTPRFVIALGLPLDDWIAVAGRTVRLQMTKESAKWGVTLFLGMALFGAATFYTARGIPLGRNIVDVTTPRYRATLNDDVLNVASLPSEIILPTSFPRGKTIIVKDGTGRANSSPIKIEVEDGSKISGLAFVSVNVDRGSWSFI